MDIKSKVISGAKWNTADTVVTFVMQFLTTIIIARFLSPKEYGIYGILILFIGFVQIFSDAGMGNAIIYKQECDKGKLSSLVFFNILVGILIVILFIIFAPLIALFYNEPQLKNLMMLFSINYFIISAGQVFISLARKDLNFKLICISDVFACVINLLSVFLFIRYGMGVAGLILAQIIMNTVKIAIIMFQTMESYKIGIHFKYTDISEFLSYGMFQLGDRILNYFTHNIDYLLISKLMGAEALGIYSLAYNIMMVPLSKINPVITQVAFSWFSKINDSTEKIRYAYYKAIKYISLAVMPCFIGMLVVSPYFIHILYGYKWDASVNILRILCIAGIIRCLINPIGTVYMSTGKPEIGVKFHVVLVMSMAVTITIGTRWSITGVAFATLICLLFVAWPMDFYYRKKLIGTKINEYFISIKTPIISTIIMLLSLLVIQKFIKLANEFYLMNILIFCGVLIYIACITLFDKSLLKVIKQYIYLY